MSRAQAAIDAYHRVLLADPASARVQAERLREAFAREGVLYRGEPMASLLRPQLVSRAEWEALRSLGGRLLELAARVARQAFDGDVSRLGDFLGTPVAEAALVARTLPRTRRVAERRTRRGAREVDLVPFMLEAREGLVHKPAHAWGGRAVVLGAETSPAEWETAVREALESPWVVQERVAIPEEPFPVFTDQGLALHPRKVSTSPFYVAGEEAGAVGRVSGSPVINVAAGGGSVPTFVVD